MSSAMQERMRRKRLERRGGGTPVIRGPSETEAAPAPPAPPPYEAVDDAVVFLDGMGTLNGHALRLRRGDDAIDPGAVATVNAILSRTGARVVVSSSWRFEGSCRARLVAAGLLDAFHDDWTTGPYRSDLQGSRQRGREIDAWLERHPEIARYAILDDDDGMLRHQHDHHVRIDHAYGIHPLQDDCAVRILELTRTRPPEGGQAARPG